MASPRAPAVFVGREAELARFAEATLHVHLAVVYGLPGIGKTAFALRAVEDLAARTGARVIVHACRPGESMATIAAVVAPAARGQDALEALAAAATERPLVLCLDDAHRAGEGPLVEAVAHLATLRLPLWLVVCSREALSISPATIDHLVVRLGGLSPDEARAMWAALEGLYGAAPAPLGTSALASGSPWLLKHAFAGPASRGGGDPLALADLPLLAGRLLSLACAFRGATPRAALEAAGEDGPRRAGALAILERRFLVEGAAADEIAVDALVREAVARSPLAPGPAEHRAALAHVRAARAAAPAAEDLELEEIHHALLAGELDGAEALLLERASYLRRVMPMSAVVERELAADLARLAKARGPRLPAPLVLFGARIANRQGRPAAALEAARPLAAKGDPLAALEAGEAALPLARFDEAVPWLERAREATELGPLAQMWATVVLVETHRTRGALGHAEELLAASAPRFALFGALGTCLEAWLAGVVAHDGERYEAAVEALGRARRALAAAPEIPATTPLLASLERAAAAGAGRPEPAGSEPGELWDETLFYRMGARILRAQERFFRGKSAEGAALADGAAELARGGDYHNVSDWGAWIAGEARRAEGRPAALALELEAAARTARGHGNVRTAVRIEQVLARCLLDLGRPEDARTRARAALADAAAMPGTSARLQGVIAVADALGRSGARRASDAAASATVVAGGEGWDHLDAALLGTEALLVRGELDAAAEAAAAAETVAARAGWAHLTCRSRLLAAEAAFARADLPAARSAWDAARGVAEAEGWEVEIAHAGLVGAALARAAGDLAGAARELSKVAARAGDRGLVVQAEAALVASAGLERVTGAGRANASPAGLRLAARFGLDSPATLRLREPAGSILLTEAQAARLSLDDRSLVIDLPGGTARAGRKRAALGKRPALIDLLRALSRSPGTTVTVDQLVADAWGVAYHPVRHHSRVTMAISRLRTLLGKTAVTGGREGYALATDGRWAVLERAG